MKKHLRPTEEEQIAVATAALQSAVSLLADLDFGSDVESTSIRRIIAAFSEIKRVEREASERFISANSGKAKDVFGFHLDSKHILATAIHAAEDHKRFSTDLSDWHPYSEAVRVSLVFAAAVCVIDHATAIDDLLTDGINAVGEGEPITREASE